MNLFLATSIFEYFLNTRPGSLAITFTFEDYEDGMRRIVNS